jgi:gamma-D-glutamyl-L-lysine dipeptidyl-peptidase
LSCGSQISLIKRKNNMIKFEKNKWINVGDVKLVKYETKNYFKHIKKFIGVKYKWGGKSYQGIDCSALIQLLLNFNNKFCPRDTKYQVRYFKKQIKINNIIKNDLIFWKGHVAIIINKNKLIHAYGPYKKVVLMNIKKTIKKILLTAGLKVTYIKRIYK